MIRRTKTVMIIVEMERIAKDTGRCSHTFRGNVVTIRYGPAVQSKLQYYLNGRRVARKCIDGIDGRRHMPFANIRTNTINLLTRRLSYYERLYPNL